MAGNGDRNARRIRVFLRVRVEDEAAHFVAARQHLLGQGGDEADMETILGTGRAPRVDRCLVELLDQWTIPGCSVEDSDAEPDLS